MLLSCVTHAEAMAKKELLPRTFGPLTLGMTEAAFKKVTAVAKPYFGLTPYFCHHCAQDETIASIFVDRHPRIFPEYLYTLSKDEGGFGCFFYRGKLYRIETSSEIKKIDAAKKHYTALYGTPSRIEDWPNGVSWVTWENKTTAFVLAYNREKGGTFWYPIPPGTVTLVQYIDKPLRDALEAQEKKKPTRQHH